jgi:hypothetical protein
VLQALCIARRALGTPVTSVVVAAEETGSGIALAARGRHFASSTAAGHAVAKGKAIRGLGEGASVVCINVHDRSGETRPLSAVDRDVRDAVARAVASERGVILHVMDHSKLGNRAPSEVCLEHMRARWGRSLQVVADACQARLGRQRCRDYLDRGFMVVITGSKFFTGPPLSGALLVPAALRPPSHGDGDAEMWAGLSAYTSREDWPESWTAHAGLSAQANTGQLLRWTAALEEMHAYFAVPELFRKLVLAEFAAVATRSIGKYDDLRLLPAPEWAAQAAGDGEFGTRTIFPIKVIRRGRALTFAESRILYEMLNRDLSGLAAFRGRGDLGELAAQICHVGQPVAIGDNENDTGVTGVIRLSAGARLASQSWPADGMASATESACARIGELDTVLAKLALIAAHFDDVRRHRAESAPPAA